MQHQKLNMDTGEKEETKDLFGGAYM